MSSKIFILISALLPMLLASANAQDKSHITLFGVVDDGLVHTYQKKNLDGKKTVQNKTELRSGVYRGARWGVRGIEDLGGGYSVGFVLDAGFKDDNGQQTMGRLFGRESSLNVKRPFGELYFGRIGAITSGAGPMAIAAWYSPFGTSCGQFAVTSYNYMFNFQRVDNSVSYRSPALQNTRLLLQYSRDVDGLEDIDPNKAGIQHGEEGKSSTGQYYAIGFQYNNKKVDFNLGTDHLTYSKNAAGIKPKGAYTVTFGGSVKYSKLKIYSGAQVFWHANSKWITTYNLLWNQQAYLNGYAVLGGIEYVIGGGQAMAAVGYSKTRSATLDQERRGHMTGASLGYAYPLSKRTNLYFLFNANYARQSYGSSPAVKTTTFEEAIGLTHFF